jgi:hypothetical protein
MYLLYADESGTTHDLNQQYFVLAGFCIFERQGYWISDQLDKVVEESGEAILKVIERKLLKIFCRFFYSHTPVTDYSQVSSKRLWYRQKTLLKLHLNNLLVDLIDI